jgi:hypothetical protein
MANHPNRKKEAEVNHAEQNAAAWYSNIAELVTALECDYGRLEELTDERAALCDDISEKQYTANDAEAQADTLDNGAAEKALEDAQKALIDWDTENGDELRELTEAATIEGEIQKDAEAVRERIQESPLSVEVRSGWHTPGGDNTPEEFNILLSTGGPALRIIGDLDEHGEPTRAYLQYQDWGTPWTDYFPGSGSGEVLLTYCQQFYFGE